MERRGDKVDIVQRVSCWISDMAFARFKSFSDRVLGIQIDEIPTVESILMRQNFSVVFYAAILFILTNGIYLVKNIAARSMIPIDMVPLYMMIGGSLAMLVFTIAYKKRGGEYDAPPARFALLAYYGVVIASVTVFMVSCNFHRVGLSISMCYLFAIMIAPTYRRVDTVAVCVLILISWWLPGQLPYAENYDLFKHFLLRFSIIVGFIVLRSIFLRQSANERHIKEMGHAFIKLAYNDVMTETLNKKAMETYGTFIADKIAPERVSVIIFDVDDFKSYNDNYSHMKGDEALKCIAESVAAVLEEMGLESVGGPGTTAALALLNDAVKKGGVMASSHVGGLSGAFIPVSEDAGMIAAAEAGRLTIEKLEAMTCVCSVGLDMIAVPGDTPAETISAIIADEAAIGMINNKTTAVRIIPAPGKQVGDTVAFGGLLGSAPVMPVNRCSAAEFIARGGRIPAPLHSLKN